MCCQPFRIGWSSLQVPAVLLAVLRPPIEDGLNDHCVPVHRAIAILAAANHPLAVLEDAELMDGRCLACWVMDLSLVVVEIMDIFQMSHCSWISY